MNLEKKFEAFLTCVICDPDLKELLEDLIDSNVLSVIYPPVRIKLLIGDSLKIKITDGINSYVMHPNDIDDNMLQDIAQAYSKYKPDESDSEDETEKRESHPAEETIPRNYPEDWKKFKNEFRLKDRMWEEDYV